MKKAEVSTLKFVVLGAARSGIAAARLLKKHGADVILADSKDITQAGHEREEMEILGIPTAWGPDATQAAISGRDVMIKSPGIPQDNPLIIQARESGMRIISEIELASAFVAPDAKVVAITGTNGKTTTTAWTAHVLNECGFNAILAGNIGDAWCNRVEDISAIDNDNTVFVVEVSSFQLEDLEDFRPDVAVLTNITPDHMDRYEDRMDLYVAAKANILRNMTGESILIWNGNHTTCRELAASSAARSCPFSSHDANPGHAATVSAGSIYLSDLDTPLMATADLPIPGTHNLENALCAALVAHAIGGSPECIAAGLKSFAGVEHRIELCGSRPDGVKFYNDSKATNLDAMEKALQSFEAGIVLIAGGRDAHSDYASISQLVRDKVAYMVTIGEAAELIENAWGDLAPNRRASNMDEAVKLASDFAQPGMVVLFSPACKSFDMYNNYEERGRDFKRCVTDLGF